MQKEDIYNLQRFIDAQESSYIIALLEIKNGKKRSHWMWYIFPQLSELGHSSTAKYYGINSIEEAKAYLNNSILKKHLVEISKELYKLNDEISNIMGYPDDLKLKSCMTLFSYIDPAIDIFNKIIEKFYNGERDQITLDLLNSQRK